MTSETQKKGMLKMHEVNIRSVRGHVEVYDAAGQFLFSADTEAEALQELREAA